MTTAQTSKTPIITTGGDGNNKFTKIALIVLAVVLVIIISEAGYYIFIKSGIRKAATVNTSTATPIQPPTSEITSDTDQSQIPDMNPPETINYEKLNKFISMFESFEPELKLFRKADINLTVAGTITNARFENLTINNLKYIYTIDLKDEFGQLIIRLTEKEVIDAETFLFTVDGKREISLSDIKSGDFIVFKKTIDILDSSPHSKVVLEVQR